MLSTDLDYRVKVMNAHTIQIGITVKELGSFLVQILNDSEDAFLEFVLNIEKSTKDNRYVILSGRPIGEKSFNMLELCVRTRDILFMEKIS